MNSVAKFSILLAVLFTISLIIIIGQGQSLAEGSNQNPALITSDSTQIASTPGEDNNEVINGLGQTYKSNQPSQSNQSNKPEIPKIAQNDSNDTFNINNTSTNNSSKNSLPAGTINTALEFLGVPQLGDGKSERKTESPRNTQSSSQRLIRNPDGSMGRNSSTSLDVSGISLQDRLLRWALSAGSGTVSSWAEGWLQNYGQARLSINFDDKGHFQGFGDVLIPIFDTEGRSFFGQVGFRTMSNDRVIGNLGLGQRFFFEPNLALGANAFIDYDFTRGHIRGGLGLEFWADWLRLSSNFYTPLSS
jgi:hypothetical protein